jgi:predicted membrane channel-forming protein YqfA (hemolysin III family)
MGIETAPQRQKSRRQQWRERPDEDSLQRAWREVRKASVVFGLAVASLPPAAPFVALLGFASADDFAISDMVIPFLYLIGLAMFWFIGAGSFFLFWHGKRLEIVERFDCLSLCATLTFLLPTIISLGALFFTDELDMGSPGTILALGLVGLCVTPLGMFGGWMLWRIAIRPAERPLQDIAEVF